MIGTLQDLEEGQVIGNSVHVGIIGRDAKTVIHLRGTDNSSTSGKVVEVPISQIKYIWGGGFLLK